MATRRTAVPMIPGEAAELEAEAAADLVEAAQQDQAPAGPQPDEIDPTTIRQAVLTPDGWVVPNPKGQ